MRRPTVSCHLQPQPGRGRENLCSIIRVVAVIFMSLGVSVRRGPLHNPNHNRGEHCFRPLLNWDVDEDCGVCTLIGNSKDSRNLSLALTPEMDED
jgi:hypothetical protein